MKYIDDMWTQLFLEESIPEKNLTFLRSAIMDEVLAAPVDFAARREMEKRRKQGKFLFVCVILMVLSFAFFLWLNSSILLDLWLQMKLADEIQQKISMLLELKSGIVTLGETYTWQLTGIGVVVLLALAELKEKMIPNSFKR